MLNDIIIKNCENSETCSINKEKSKIFFIYSLSVFTFAHLVASSKYSILFIIAGISFILSKSEFNHKISSK